MPRPPRLGPEQDRRHLAGMIDIEMKRGQRPEGANGEPWTNQGLAAAAFGSDSGVRGWRGAPGVDLATPNTIVPILNAFYGPDATTAFPAQSAAMRHAWRRAKNYLDDDAPASAPRALQHHSFTGPVHLVDLTASQPTPDNAGNLIVPYTLHIYPDTTQEYRGQRVEIGLTAACVKVEARAWQPNAESVFRHKIHPNARGTATKHAIDAIGPLDAKGRLAGAPLADQPPVTMEASPPSGLDTAADDIAFQVQAAREWFDVTIPGAPENISAIQKAVLAALFADAFPRTDHNQHIVASATVAGKARKDPPQCP